MTPPDSGLQRAEQALAKMVVHVEQSLRLAEQRSAKIDEKALDRREANILLRIFGRIAGRNR